MNVSVTVAMLYHPQYSEWVKQACKWRAGWGCKDAPQKVQTVQCSISLSAISWNARWIVQFAWCRASDIRDSSERQSWRSHGTGRAVNLSGQCQRQEKECAFSHTKHASRLRSPALLDNHALPARFQQRLPTTRSLATPHLLDHRLRVSSPPVQRFAPFPFFRLCFFFSPFRQPGAAGIRSRRLVTLPQPHVHPRPLTLLALRLSLPHLTSRVSKPRPLAYHTTLTA